MFFFGSKPKQRLNNAKSKYSNNGRFGYGKFFFLTTITAVVCGLYWQDVLKIGYSLSRESLSNRSISLISQELQTLYELNIKQNEEDDNVYQDGLERHRINLFVSDKLNPNRDVPDPRHEQCTLASYPNDLPTVSVVICFVNEAFSTLTRTVQSVINRTPSHLLKELILIDDFSHLDHLKNPLKEHIALHFPNVTLVRNTERMGLIESRIRGSRMATGKVLLFLDSHCEVNTGWIEPLLLRIQENRTRVVSPVIDQIDKDTLVYQSVPVFKGGFEWNLDMRWEPLSPELQKDVKSQYTPIQTPVTPGGIFAIDLGYFRELGEFDPHLKLWGGEQIHLSIKAWQCGGSVEIHPCSRVGHIYRKPEAGTTNLNIYVANLAWIAHIWMDDYKDYFLAARPETKDLDVGDITEALAARTSMGCKSFSWYMQNIYPEQEAFPFNLVIVTMNRQQGCLSISLLKQSNTQWGTLPSQLPPTDDLYKKKKDERDNRRYKVIQDNRHATILRKGKILHTKTNLCLRYQEVLPVESNQFTVILANCSNNKTVTFDAWSQTNRYDIRFYTSAFCLHTPHNNQTMLERCNNSNEQLYIWREQNTTSQLYNPRSGRCLQPVFNENNSYLHLTYCAHSDDMDFKFIT